MSFTMSRSIKLGLLAILGLVLMFAVHFTVAKDGGDKIIIMPPKHKHKAHHQYIPYPMYIPYHSGGGGYDGQVTHSYSMGGYGSYGGYAGYGGYDMGNYGGYGGLSSYGMGDLMSSY